MLLSLTIKQSWLLFHISHGATLQSPLCPSSNQRPPKNNRIRRSGLLIGNRAVVGNRVSVSVEACRRWWSTKWSSLQQALGSEAGTYTHLLICSTCWLKNQDLEASPDLFCQSPKVAVNWKYRRDKFSKIWDCRQQCHRNRPTYLDSYGIYFFKF